MAIPEVPVAKMMFNSQFLGDFWTEQESQKASFHICGKLMSSPLSTEPGEQYNVRSVPIQKDDEVQVVGGHYKGQRIGKVVQVYRKKYAIYVKYRGRRRTARPPVWVFTLARWVSLDETQTKTLNIKPSLAK